MAIKVIIRRQGAAPGAPPFAERILDGPIITIGRDASATLQLDDPAVAPEQAVIINEDGLLLLINRADGTSLNEEALARGGRRPLAHGDRLTVGSYLVSFALSDDAGAPDGARAAATPSHPAPTQASPEQSRAASQPEAARTPEEGTAGASSRGTGHTSAGSFAAILDSLRTEEDRFYFLVENAGRRGERVAVETAEMLVGWDETGRYITCEAASVATARAVVRKDWSGVVVQPQSPRQVSVNGEAVETVRRLRNGDRLTLVAAAAAAGTSPETHYLIFHEPASLVVLDSLLPQQLPPPVATRVAGADNGSAGDAGQALAPVSGLAAAGGARTAPRRAGFFSPGRKYFGYFTLVEVLVMMTGTLVAALAIFLILEYS
jgi:hypothetical protein